MEIAGSIPATAIVLIIFFTMIEQLTVEEILSKVELTDQNIYFYFQSGHEEFLSTTKTAISFLNRFKSDTILTLDQDDGDFNIILDLEE